MGTDEKDTNASSTNSTPAGIPEDDGHQMSQAEIDALIASLLN